MCGIAARVGALLCLLAPGVGAEHAGIAGRVAEWTRRPFRVGETTPASVRYSSDPSSVQPGAELSVRRSAPLLTWSQDRLHRVYRITAYCDRGVTASGVPSGVGQCAAPADIPFGSLVYIPELDRRFIVTDRTAERFRHNTIDVFIPEKSDCLEFGMSYREVEITLPTATPRYGCGGLLAAVRRHARTF